MRHAACQLETREIPNYPRWCWMEAVPGTQDKNVELSMSTHQPHEPSLTLTALLTNCQIIFYNLPRDSGSHHQVQHFLR